MESGSRSSVEYEVEVEDGIASLYANSEFVESVEENRISELLKEYLTNPEKRYIGEAPGGIHLYKVRDQFRSFRKEHLSEENRATKQ